MIAYTSEMHTKDKGEVIQPGSLWFAADGSPKYATVKKVDKKSNDISYVINEEQKSCEADVYTFTSCYYEVKAVELDRTAVLILKKQNVDQLKLETQLKKDKCETLLAQGPERDEISLLYGIRGGTQVDAAIWLLKQLAPILNKPVTLEIGAQDTKQSLVITYMPKKEMDL
jgi:hypothetical protein